MNPIDLTTILWICLSAACALVLTLIGVIYGISNKRTESAEANAREISEKLQTIALTISTLNGDLRGGLAGLDRRVEDMEMYNLNTRIAIVEEKIKILAQ